MYWFSSHFAPAALVNLYGSLAECMQVDRSIRCQGDLVAALAQQLDAELQAKTAEHALQAAATEIAKNQHQQEQQPTTAGVLQGTCTAQVADEACDVTTACLHRSQVSCCLLAAAWHCGACSDW